MFHVAIGNMTLGADMARQRNDTHSVTPESEQVECGQVLDLTTRQAEVLGLAALGFSRKEIGRHLGISVRTVEAHFSGMRRRTGARSDGELIARAAAAGTVTPGISPPRRSAGHGEAPAQESPKPGPRPYPRTDNRSVSNTLGGSGQDQVSAHAAMWEKGGKELSDPGPEPPPGAPVGYARVFTARQNLDWQIQALKDVGCIHVFADRQSGKTAGRPELEACLDCLRPGDTMVVPSLDRLSCSLHELVTMVVGLSRRDLGFRSLHEGLDTTTPSGRLVFHVFTALAEFIRELIAQGTHEGIAADRGTRAPPSALTPEQIRHAWAVLAHPDNTVSSIARLLGVSRATIYSHIPELASCSCQSSTGSDPV